MKGGWKGCLRIRLGSYRAVFQLSDDPPVDSEVVTAGNPRLITVLVVGPRGDIHKG